MKSFCLTDVGIKRDMNQDFVYASDQRVGCLPNLYIVADGMGGHNAGDFASRHAVETMVDYIENAREESPVSVLARAAEAANYFVYEKSISDRSMEGMGTTLVAATVVEDCLYLINIGDSRLYLLDGGIEQISVDHSLVEDMVQAGEITHEEARTHPDKNVITRAVGTKKRVRADLFDVALNEGDKILMCSDGLCNMLTDKEILSLVREADSLEEAGRKLVDAANQNGGSDNISVILAQSTGDEVTVC